ncbi:MAG: SMC-Scp complex subunit ScpB [Atopobiaceae bacterium]|nr:SMC-Scp complex subunit ScpB [Atopobiaceae bacterium]
MLGQVILEEGSHKAALEAMPLVTNDPVSASELSRVLGMTPGEVATLLNELAEEYTQANRGIQLREVAGGWRLYTHPAFHDLIESYVMGWDTRRLSQAALETLAVIAYMQPVTREGVRGVRGVNSDGVISTLVDKGLVREAGRESGRSQAILYATTQSFLEQFGLKSLKQLPELEQFAPDERSREFIRERLSGIAAPTTIDEAVEEDEDLGYVDLGQGHEYSEDEID